MNDKPDKKSETVAKPVQDNVVALPIEWPLRLFGGLMILSFMVCAAFVTITIKESLVSKRLEQWQQNFYDFSSGLGFNLEDVLVSGRKRTSLAELETAINLSRNDNIFEIKVGELKQRLEKLSWVKSAVVRKSFLPNVINISIEEKKVQTLWQVHENFHPIDMDGKVIEAKYIPDRPILLIVGDEAPENINNLLSIIKNDQEIFKRVKVANYISQRRWNLVLDDIGQGITIKLPEENVEKAWKKLIKLNETKGLLKRKLTIIDLRLDDKVVIKLRKDSENKNAGLKNDKERRT